MPNRSREIEHLLQFKFRFTEAAHHGADHKWYELRIEGLPVIRTKVSHGRKDIGDNLLAAMAKQLRVTRPFFDEMMGCTKSCDEYYRMLGTNPRPPFNQRA